MASMWVKGWALWRNALSRLYDRQSERLAMGLVPTFATPDALWDYLRRYIPYTGDPALPWQEGKTAGALDYTVHPLRLLYHAENNRAYVKSGYQFFWPQHVAVDCDDVALLAAWLSEYSGLGKAQVVLLVGTPASATHAICVLQHPDGRVTSLDTSGVHAHASMQAAIWFMEDLFSVRYAAHAMPQPFGLHFDLEVNV